MCALRPSLTFFWGLNYLFLQSFAALFWIEFHFFLFGEGGCVFDKSTIFAEQSTLQSMPSAQRKHRKGRGSKRATSSRKTAKAVARGGKESDLLVRAPELAAEAAAEAQPESLYIDMTDPNVEIGVLVDPAVGARWTSPEPAQPLRARVVSPTASQRVVYLLVTEDMTQSYIGSTNFMERRLRQHNMEIKGGAWATSLQVKQGHRWILAMHMQGFSNTAAAYNFEAKWR